MIIPVNDIIPILRHIAIVCVFLAIVLAPAYLAAVNGSAKYNRMRVRVGSWLFGMSFIGWIFALFVSTKK